MDEMKKKLKLIALVGPESTGKTTLCKQLAAHYNGVEVPEFAREFLEKTNGKYSESDLLTIAHGQLQLERDAISNGTLPVFCDTDAVVVMVWHEFKYGKRNLELETTFHQQTPRKYLLTYPDLPWQNDPLRENPNDLNAIFGLYVSTLDRLQAEYSIVNGVGPMRFENALDALGRMNFG